MYTLNHKYKSKELLQEWIDKNNFASKKECLVQFFSGIAKENKMNNIANILSDNLPNAHIIGTTTDGEISKDIVTTREIIISVSVFEKSTISSAGVEYDTNSYDLGLKIASTLDSNDIKAMILFTTGLAINAEEFLNGVRVISKDKYIISGGMAGDNANFKQTYASHKNNVIKKGAVGVVLKGDELNVKNNYQFGWDAVGLPMKVTKSKGNKVYELDDTPIIDIYKKYFSKEVSNLLPKVGVEIPLIIKRHGNKIARACINRFDDGSLLFAGNILEGEYVHFGIGNTENILRKSQSVCKKFGETCTPETIFVYSCMARRRLLKAKSSLELKELSKRCSVSGFFTYGEFFSDKGGNYLFNETMTILAISESGFIQKSAVKENTKEDEYKDARDNTMIHALTHMTNVMAKEWQEKVDIEIEKNREKEKQLLQQSKLAQMGDMISMIAHQWRQPLNAISATGINLSLLSSMEMLEDEKVQESSKFIQDQTQKMSSTIDTFMNFVKPAKESKPFKLLHTVEAIMQIMGAQLINHNIKINIDSKDENISIVGYEDLLEQVIINLLSNSKDAFEELDNDNKFINITIDEKEDTPTITIEDNASGIPHDIEDKIFNPYFTTKEQGKGTGIGLYMSMDIMRKSFGGDLRYSAADNGSRFEIVLK